MEGAGLVGRRTPGWHPAGARRTPRARPAAKRELSPLPPRPLPVTTSLTLRGSSLLGASVPLCCSEWRRRWMRAPPWLQRSAGLL